MSNRHRCSSRNLISQKVFFLFCFVLLFGAGRGRLKRLSGNMDFPLVSAGKVTTEDASLNICRKYYSATTLLIWRGLFYYVCSVNIKTPQSMQNTGLALSFQGGRLSSGVTETTWHYRHVEKWGMDTTFNEDALSCMFRVKRILG